MFLSAILKSKKDGSVFDANLNDNSASLNFEEVRQQIRELAYQKWESAGYPAGRAEEFWVEAEKELFGNEPLVEGGYRIRLDSGEFLIVRP